MTREDKSRSIWTWVAFITDAPYDTEDTSCRKPLAWATTRDTAKAYAALTGKQVTRVTKKVTGKKGDHHEAGAFAKLLAEVFEILDIKSSPAAQVKRLLKHRRLNPSV
ncbi:MAG: hypothetical protein ACREYF_00360 [Gammaproteobacteria bacterium]